MRFLKNKKIWVVVALMILGVFVNENFILLGAALWAIFAYRAKSFNAKGGGDESYEAKTGAGYQYGTDDTSGTHPTSFYS